MGKRHLIILYIFFTVQDVSLGQDPGWSHFFIPSVSINPAFTGITGSGRFETGYRNQWPGFNKTYVTYRSAYDQKMDILGGGIGVQVFRDVMADGTFSSTNFDFVYAYHARLSQTAFLYFGLSASALQSNRSAAVINGFPAWYNGGIYVEEAIPGTNKLSPDFSTGFHLKYLENSFGMVVDHLLEPVQFNSSESRLHRKYQLYAGKRFRIRNRLISDPESAVKTFVMFRKQGNHDQLNYGINYEQSFFELGAWLQQDFGFKNTSLILSTGIKYLYLYILYSYDFSISNFSFGMKNLGIHEVTLMINFEYNRKRKKIKAIKCPKI